MYAQTHKHIAQTFLKIPKEMMAQGQKERQLEICIKN